MALEPTTATTAAAATVRAAPPPAGGAGREAPLAYAFLAPALLILLTFLLVPAAWIFGIALYRWDLISPTPEFVGLANFERLFLRDDLFWQSLWQTAYYVAVTVPASLALGLLLAVLLDRAMPLRDLMRTVVFAPYVMPLVATVIIWTFMFNVDYGVLNALLRAVGLPPVRWLDDPRAIMPALMLYSVWQHSGYNAAIFLAGLANQPPELDEAAQVDGAGRWTRFWRITWPLLSPTTYFLLLVNVIASFKVVQPVIVFTGGVGGAGASGGGPNHAAETIGYYLYTSAFASFKAGRAGALSVVLFLIVLAITALQMGVFNRRVFYR